MKLKLMLMMLFVIILVVPSIARADVSLSLIWDRDTRTSKVFLKGSDGAVIAELNWDDHLPTGYSDDGTVKYVPTLVLGHLRDQADQSSHSEASSAASWMRSMMGDWFDTPLDDIPDDIISPIPTGTTTYWCGVKADSNGNCPSDCIPWDNPKTCSGCGCAGQKDS